MTDSELNEKVARKLGWEWNDNEKAWYSPWHVTEPYIPDYCTDIGAAWEIAEKFKIHLIPTDKGWLAGSGEIIEEGNCLEIWKSTNCGTRGECGCLRCAIADTAPRAICEAFLKLED